MGQQRCHIFLIPIGQKQRHTVRGQHLDDLRDHILRHRSWTVADLDGTQPLAHRIACCPPPARPSGDHALRWRCPAQPTSTPPLYGWRVPATGARKPHLDALRCRTAEGEGLQRVRGHAWISQDVR